MANNEEFDSGGAMYPPFVKVEDKPSKPQDERPFNSGGRLFTPGLNPEREPTQVSIKISPKTE